LFLTLIGLLVLGGRLVALAIPQIFVIVFVFDDYDADLIFVTDFKDYIRGEQSVMW